MLILCILMVNQKNAMRENFTIKTVYFSSNFRAEIEKHMSLKTLEIVFPGAQISKFGDVILMFSHTYFVFKIIKCLQFQNNFKVYMKCLKGSKSFNLFLKMVLFLDFCAFFVREISSRKANI